MRSAAALLIAAVALSVSGRPTAGQVPAATGFVEDFDVAWTFVRDRYAYFDRKQTDWDKVRTVYRPRAAAAGSRSQLIAVLETAIAELYDHHAHLGVNTSSSPRLVPSGADLWAEHRDGRAIVTDVRAGSEAGRAGVRAGMEVVSIGRQPIVEAVRERAPVCLREPDPAAADWALRSALAGRHGAAVEVAVRHAGAVQRFTFRPGQVTRPAEPLSYRILDGNIGYLRINDSLGDVALIAAWDAALEAMRYTRGLVVDLRDTPGGGNTTIARALLGRFVSDVRPYQRHDLPAEERRFGVRRIWVEYVAPRGPFVYEVPVAALVGRWTGSMGEGTAIGLDALHRTVVGTAMAGLLGATDSTRLRHTGIDVRIPVERLFHIDGTPREAFMPSVRPDPAIDAIEAARALLLKQVGAK